MSVNMLFKVIYVIGLTYNTAIALIKTSILAFYLRIGKIRISTGRLKHDN